MISVNELLDRAKERLGLRRDAELADLLGVTSTNINNWRKRDSVGTALEHILDKQPNLAIGELISGDINASAPGSTAIGHVIHAACLAINTELDKQFDVAKRLIAGSSEKQDELLALLKEFNKRMI